MKSVIIKTLEAVFVLSAIIIVIGVIAGLFESSDDKAARELKNEQDKIAATPQKAEKAVEDNASEPANATPIDTLVADNQPDPTIGGKTRMEVLVECQTAIQKQLSNPRSFDVKTREIIHKKYEDGGEHLVGFKFYAKNQFNAESEHMAVCAFDHNGKRLTAEYK